MSFRQKYYHNRRDKELKEIAKYYEANKETINARKRKNYRDAKPKVRHNQA